MEGSSSKLSFSFNKTTKKNEFVKPKVQNAKVEIIEAIEGSQLKIAGKDTDDGEKKLVIPMTEDQKTKPIARLIEKRRNIGNVNKTEIVESNKCEEETLDQRAAREIIEDLQKRNDEIKAKVLELPLHPDELPLFGASESTLEDYDSVPISDFGKAMLRGMGWKEEEKKNGEELADMPIMRPKGLGLGADKVIKKQPLLIAPSPNETLEIKKNACVKILAGKHKNMYGTIEGFDDNARVIVKLTIGNFKIIINEFMVQPVSKQELAKYGKIINAEKYESFKNNKEQPSLQSESSEKYKRRSRSLSPSTSKDKSRDRRSKSYEKKSSSRKHTESDRSRDRRKHSSDSEDDKTNNRKYHERKRSRSNEKLRGRSPSNSNSSDDRHHSKKKSSKKSGKSKSKKYYSHDQSRDLSDDERKHKRKYKRSKHHRDRS